MCASVASGAQDGFRTDDDTETSAGVVRRAAARPFPVGELTSVFDRAAAIIRWMDGPSAYPSQGECDVADYLLRRGIRFEYEATIGTRHPDFLAHGPDCDVVLEVYEPSLRLSNSVGSFDHVAPLYGAFDERKRKQAKASRAAGFPFVVVIGSANSTESMAAANQTGCVRRRRAAIGAHPAP